MGIFGASRKQKKEAAAAKPNFAAANAFYEAASAKILGSELSLGTKLITAEILGGHAAKYELTRSPESFRLGVLGCYAMTAALFPDKKILGVVMAKNKETADAYRNDTYGEKKISMQEYLSAFGIEVLPEGYLGIRSADGMSYMLSCKNKMLGITWDALFKDRIGTLEQRFITHPVVVDDGLQAQQYQKR